MDMLKVVYISKDRNQRNNLIIVGIKETIQLYNADDLEISFTRKSFLLQRS